MTKQEKIRFIIKFYQKYIDGKQPLSSTKRENLDVEKKRKRFQQIYGAQIAFNQDHNHNQNLNTLYSKAQSNYTANSTSKKRHHHKSYIVQPLINNSTNHQTKRDLKRHQEQDELER